MKKYLAPPVLALCLTFAGPVAAQVAVVHYDRTAFDLAAGSTTTIDFEGILAPNESSHIFPGGFTVSGEASPPV